MVRIAVIVALAVVVGLGGRLWLLANHDGPTRDSLGGPFALTDETGTPVTEADYAGQYLLVYFGYTHCPTICPLSLQHMADALARLTPGQRARLQPLFISVDWQRDTPERVAEYTDYFHPAIVGLTGTRAQVEAASAAYGVRYGPGVEEDIDHTALIFLMGPDGGFRRGFAMDATGETIAEGIRATLARDS